MNPVDRPRPVDSNRQTGLDGGARGNNSAARETLSARKSLPIGRFSAATDFELGPISPLLAPIDFSAEFSENRRAVSAGCCVPVLQKYCTKMAVLLSAYFVGIAIVVTSHCSLYNFIAIVSSTHVPKVGAIVLDDFIVSVQGSVPIKLL